MVSSYAAFGIVFMFFWGIYYLCYNKIIKEEDLICSDYIKSFLQSARPNLRIFCLHSVEVARYAALIQAKSPTNCNVHLTESIFQTRSSSQDYISCQAFSIPYILSRI